MQVPDSGTINGVGRYVGGPTVTRPRINVVAGQRYRFRVINTSAYSGFTFSIEGHTLTIIEVRITLHVVLLSYRVLRLMLTQVDGINHVAHTVDGFEIYPGQRYSVVLNANQAVRNYWIRAPMKLQHSSNNNNRELLL